MVMSTDFDITVVGAGVVGLAIAARIAGPSHSVVVLEKHKKFGQETSSRNSEVIHSGIYYPRGSLKAVLCVRGREMLYEYCRQHDVRFSRCGKLVIATSVDEEAELGAILETARGNGVTEGRIIDAGEVREREPNISVRSAIHFPSSGIVDSHGLMKSLETTSLSNGATFAYGNELTGLRMKGGGSEPVFYELEATTAEGEAFSFTSRIVINAAGLEADKVAAMAGMTGTNGTGYKLHLLKGEYFRIGNGKNRLVNGLIYPVPHKNISSLGVHVTIDLDGGAKLGPNEVVLENGVVDYSVDSSHRADFYRSAAKFLPFIEPEDLHADQAGIRPKLQKPGGPFHDFVIKDEADAGFPGLINLVGIESPGLTACLAIAEYVHGLLPERGSQTGA